MSVLAWIYGPREVNGVEGKRFEQIVVTAEAGIATVTLNRPERYNALGSRIVDELVEAVESIEVRLIQSQRQERCRSRMSSSRPSEASSTRSSTCSKPSGPP